MSLELQYWFCCKSGFKFTETEFRWMPTSRRFKYMEIAQEYQQAKKEEAGKMKS